MNDKSLSIWLAATFGVPGLAVLLLAWLWPALAGERDVAIIVGAAGLALGALQMLAFFRTKVKVDEAGAMIRVAADDRH